MRLLTCPRCQAREEWEPSPKCVWLQNHCWYWLKRIGGGVKTKSCFTKIFMENREKGRQCQCCEVEACSIWRLTESCEDWGRPCSSFYSRPTGQPAVSWHRREGKLNNWPSRRETASTFPNHPVHQSPGSVWEESGDLSGGLELLRSDW